jgi:Sap, sulfolipid-1-addressing protein
VADLHPWQAAILGVIEQPWTLTALAAVVIVSHKAGPLAVFVAFVLFSALSTSTVITMFGYFSRRPDEADHRLAEIKARLARSGPVAAATVSALVAAVLLADGIFGLIRN